MFKKEVCILPIFIFLSACSLNNPFLASYVKEDKESSLKNNSYIDSNWTWISGNNIVNQLGIYGTKGTPAPGNIPGARQQSASNVDSSNNLLLYSGYGYDSLGNIGWQNDLWKFDGVNWTWISGNNIVNQRGVYGTKGSPASGNIPGARSSCVSWLDLTGNLWIFGGYGYDANSTQGWLNDLWKFDGLNWTWISGNNIVNQLGIYGTKGTPAPGNIPGARYYSVSWLDSTGSLYLFGGTGYDQFGNNNYLNDLWKFDGSNWTWVSGSSIVNQHGTYGTKGTPAPGNIPGARYSSVGCKDLSGNLLIFGGLGFDQNGNIGSLNDLWKFDGSNWTWASGSSIFNQQGAYGIKGISASENIPGARFSSVCWINQSGNLYIFGGKTYDSVNNFGDINDLWEFNGINWKWISGSNIISQIGIYGTKFSPSSMNIPGARQNNVSWVDTSDNLYLFGGYGYDFEGSFSRLNDLWKYNTK